MIQHDMDDTLPIDIAPLRIALIIGSTRADRFADIPARWVAGKAANRRDVTVDVLDLRDFALPFLGEVTTHGSNATIDAVSNWRRHIDRADGYIVTAAEYNHAPTAVLKNALDHGTHEWYRKPIAFVGYGGLGGARAVEHLRHIAIELQMVPVKAAIHIASDLFTALASGRTQLDAYPHFDDACTAMFDALVWWGHALRTARAAKGPASAGAELS